MVTLRAQGIGGSGSYEYEFRLRPEGSDDPWQVLQPLSGQNTALWDTAGSLGGYVVQVRARNNGSLDQPVAETVQVWINESAYPATGVRLELTPYRPQKRVLLTARASRAGPGPRQFEYRFSLLDPSTLEVLQVLRDFSSGSRMFWRTRGYAGSYLVQVEARNRGTQDRPVTARRFYHVR